MKRFILCISGVPGTGKTRAAEELGRITGCSVVSLNKLIKSGKIKSAWDRKRKTSVVSEKGLDRQVKKLLGEGNYIIEGGLAHFIRCDLCVILRTDPEVLMKRLGKRGWPGWKIRENVMAEMLDEAVIDAGTRNKRIIEIDTTRTGPKRAAVTIKMALNNYRLQRQYCPRINWIKKYPELLIKLGA
ncbi:MAG: AAA family ATPase [Candidatus Aenigmarchaeota archaeon]|nr:AAA family ATPase [Candidatus Aenigmarchaeota archaeon]